MENMLWNEIMKKLHITSNTLLPASLRMPLHCIPMDICCCMMKQEICQRKIDWQKLSSITGEPLTISFIMQ